MKIILASLLVLFKTSLTFAQSQPQDEKKVEEKELSLVVGIDKVITTDFPYSTKVQIGSESNLQLTLVPAKQEITFRGIKPGKTSVIIRDEKGVIRLKYIVDITATENSRTIGELRELIGDIEGIEIGLKGGKIYVGGEIVIPTDIGRLSAVLASYKNVLILYELSPQTRQLIAKRMEGEIVSNGMKEVTVKIVNKTYWLEGVVGSESQKELAQRIAEIYLPPDVASLASGAKRLQQAKGKPAILNLITINQKKKQAPPIKMVKIVAQFVELSKNYKRLFAFKWSPLLGEDGGTITFGKTQDGGVSTKSTGLLSGIISNLFPKLASAKSAGYARDIQSAMVITNDQQRSSISKRTTIPYAIGSGEFTRGDTATIQFNMVVTPKILQQEQIEMSLSINVTVNAGQTTGGSPRTTTNSIQSNLIVKSKESAAIGGIVQNQSSTNYDKDDPDSNSSNLQSGSFLFNILRSRNLETSKSQFVIFITPEIIGSASEGVAEVRKKFRRLN